jgi:NAD(P)-dependent dehydrogenase (short-subunit alcohol dehydrogenase family)
MTADRPPTESRTALVTGANRGLGLAVAARLLALGHRVAVAARDEAAAQRAAGALGPGAFGVPMDVTDERSIARARDQAGPVDVLVNNAGVLLAEDTWPDQVSSTVIRCTFEVNALGAWLVSQAFLPGMQARGWGRVVMVSSGTARFSGGLHTAAAAYSMSKAALNAVTVLLATAAEGSGVLVNAVNPGRVKTRMMPEATCSPQEAAVDVAWLATLPDGGPTGRLFRSRSEAAW